MRKFRTMMIAVVLGIAAGGLAVESGRESCRQSGLYVVVRNSMVPRVEELAALPFVDGITYYTGARVVMPRKGEYRWEEVDRVIKAARANGKKVSLGILPGRWTPEWFYAEGVQKFEWNLKTDLVDPGSYDAAAPVPWDPRLHELLSEMIRVAGKRYTLTPEVVAFQAVGPALVNGLEGNLNISGADAERIGYTPRKYIDSWNLMIETAARAFPHQQICWAIHDMFPDGRNGAIGRSIRDQAVKLMGRRFRVLACYLTHEPWFAPGNPSADLWLEKADVIPSGLQLINIYSMSGRSPEDLHNAMQKGIASGADYLEVFAEDALKPEFAAQMLKIHAVMQEKKP